MLNNYIQNVFYHYVLSEPLLTAKWEPSYFDDQNMQLCFKCAKDYVSKYHSAPSSSQLKELIKIEDDFSSVSNDYVDILYSSYTRMGEYESTWLYENATAWASWKHFLISLKNTVGYVKLHQDEVNVENVQEIMEYAKNSFANSCLVNFGNVEDTGSDFWNAASHKQTKMIRSSTGYEYLDICMKGGTFPGALICFAGAPKSGKSLWLQNLCAESVKKGENAAYISLELPEEMIHNRIGANMFNLPALDYEKYTEDTEAFGEVIRKFRKSCLVKPGALIVKNFPTSTLSVPDLEAYLLSKEDELSHEGMPFKFKNIYVDYINIMKNYRNPNSENTYMKIKQLAEDLKAMCIRNNWAGITATQTNRTQFDTDDVTVAQISESAGLGATVDLMFGIISTIEMAANSEYYIKCLYDRVAPYGNTKKRFVIDKVHLRITEDIASKIVDCIDEAKAKIKTMVGKIYESKDSYNQQENVQQPVLTVSDAYNSPSLLTNEIKTASIMSDGRGNDSAITMSPKTIYTINELAGMPKQNMFQNGG